MKKILFYDAKSYDQIWFDQLNTAFEINYIKSKLNEDTAALARGYDGVVAFVNDEINAKTIDVLYQNGIRVIAMRCAGYNNIDFLQSFNKIHVLRVPAYSPYAVAEYAMALLLTLNRKIHKAYDRTRTCNFSLDGLVGFDLHGKTIGVIGTGKIGQIFIDICRGFGMRVVAYDPHPKECEIEYVSLEELCKVSDVISLHCPLTKQTHHIINSQSIAQMKDGVMLINTSRGALIDSEALLKNIKSKKIGGAGLDVYEEETELFFEDFSNTIIQDDVLSLLLAMPNVIVTSHQAFLTDEALCNIARTTLDNLEAFYDDKPLLNEICYQCQLNSTCDKTHSKRCF
ncbi:MAG: 2-hydroxyacid dehydrogenase [Christensenellaceae bacterium]